MAGDDDSTRSLAARAALAAVGAAAGLAWWAVRNRLPALDLPPAAHLFLAALAAGYFGALLALAGPIRLSRALWLAAVPALPAAALLAWAGTRHDTLAGFLARPDPLFAFALLVALPLPYLVAASRSRARWRHYPTLFAQSWGMVVRLGAAALFAGMAWIATFLADEVLRLAGIDAIERLLRIDWLPPAFTGLVLGLGLAIVIERDDTLSPGLALGLLRLLVPPAFVIVAAFLAAVPVRGIDALFGVLSPGTTLLALALLVVLLVSSATDAADGACRRGPVLGWAARGLALLLPVVAILALEALRRRWLDGGMSPPRLAAMVAGGVLLAYGVIYAVSALTGRGWMERVRAGNAWMGLVVVALSALWLTPALDAERISAADQLARFESGRVPVGGLDLWALRHAWGRSGEAAFARIEASAAGHPEEALLRERLALAAQAPDAFAFYNLPTGPTVVSARSELKAAMPVQPPEAAAEVDRYILPWYAGSTGTFLDGCRDLTASGRPGCVLVVADLIPDNPGNEAILFYKSFGLLRGEVIVPEPVFRRADAADVFALQPPDFEETDRLLEALQDGDFRAEPARINAIGIGDRQFTIPF